MSPFSSCMAVLTILLFFNSRTTDPLVHHGRHFGRTIHALCNVHALINNGIVRMGERSEEPDEAFTAQYDVLCFRLIFFKIEWKLNRERREHKVFLSLLKSVPGLEDRIMTTESEEEVQNIAMLVSLLATYICRHTLCFSSCRKDHPVRDLTTQRASSRQ